MNTWIIVGLTIAATTLFYVLAIVGFVVLVLPRILPKLLARYAIQSARRRLEEMDREGGS